MRWRLHTGSIAQRRLGSLGESVLTGTLGDRDEELGADGRTVPPRDQHASI